MKPNPSSPGLARRQFLSGSTLALGALGASALAQAKAAVAGSGFEDDFDRLRRVDPALIGHEKILRFAVPQPGARRLALGPGGRLHVACGPSIITLDAQGARLGSIAVSSPVQSLALTPEGLLLAGVKDHIEVFDTQSKRIAVWPAPKGRPLLTGIAAGTDDVFVADAGNRVIWRHDPAGRLLRRLGEKDAERGIPGIVVPSPFFDVKLGRDGLLRVANPGRHRVETYTADGDLELSWGKPGAAIEAFCGCCNPCSLELLPDGRVMTFEKGLPRVKVYTADGRLESVVAPPSAFANPARARTAENEESHGGLDGVVEPGGKVFVLDLIGGDIHVFTPKPSSSA